MSSHCICYIKNIHSLLTLPKWVNKFSKFVLFFQIHELFRFEYLTILKNHKFWGSVVVEVFKKIFFSELQTVLKIFWMPNHSKKQKSTIFFLLQTKKQLENVSGELPIMVIAIFIAFFSLNHVLGTRFITDDFAIFSLENVLFLNYHFFYYIGVHYRFKTHFWHNELPFHVKKV